MNPRLILTMAAIALASTTALAAEKLDRIGETKGCHLLMTQKECEAHIGALSRLAPGAERDAFLLAHHQLMREREKACSCNHDAEILMTYTGYLPGKQALMKF